MSFFVSCNPAISKLKVVPDDVLDWLRETDRSPDNPVVSGTVQVFEELPSISDIHGGYAVFDDIEILRAEGKIRINNRALEPGARICGYMKNAEKLAVFICTAGEGFSRFSGKYNREGDYLKGYITDTFGSIIAEKAAGYIQESLEAGMREQGLQITNRYSPGYCNWQLTDQKQLFDLLPQNQCGISLSESCLMHPIKSVSGMIGIGKNVRKNSYACDICNSATCVYRKVKNKNLI
ncbi:MAG: hypothetical protein LBL57_03880 [Tannerella sp.]|jgi:hypothetical protein|nr:hypothetical protein [Tannerella sp.]